MRFESISSRLPATLTVCLFPSHTQFNFSPNSSRFARCHHNLASASRLITNNASQPAKCDYGIRAIQSRAQRGPRRRLYRKAAPTAHSWHQAQRQSEGAWQASFRFCAHRSAPFRTGLRPFNHRRAISCGLGLEPVAQRDSSKYPDRIPRAHLGRRDGSVADLDEYRCGCHRECHSYLVLDNAVPWCKWAPVPSVLYRPNGIILGSRLTADQALPLGCCADVHTLHHSMDRRCCLLQGRQRQRQKALGHLVVVMHP